jgi:hypothetical protein
MITKIWSISKNGQKNKRIIVLHNSVSREIVVENSCMDELKLYQGTRGKVKKGHSRSKSEFLTSKVSRAATKGS